MNKAYTANNKSNTQAPAPSVPFYDATENTVGFNSAHKVITKNPDALKAAGNPSPGKPAVEIGLREDNMTTLQKAMRRYNPWFAARNYLDTLGSDNSDLDPTPRPIFDERSGERDYAKLNDPIVFDTNRYGTKIDMLNITEVELPVGRSMEINGNPSVGTNPNRNKQHGFHFTADNCIGCHACEAACSEKNDNPAHLAFRSVGYVEGGSYPDFKRMNISMACNHCDNPVCMKGCPTKAYTKHAEYGAVLQDPETCFGCGYCTWVCPYNAPQLDPVEGKVSKCNMCVDRLEVGLKPACVSACLGNALNFGVIENMPENREQIKSTIPGFPDPSITNPNIRFQQTKTMPNEMSRTDSMPVKYHKQDDGTFRSVVDEKEGKAKSWNIARLSSRENPLVIFTLFTQAAMGAFILLYLGSLLGVESLVAVKNSVIYLPLLIVLAGLQAVGLLLSTMHLGKPLRFYRGFNNLRYSPVSREALGVALFFTGLAVFTGLEVLAFGFDFFELLAADSFAVSIAELIVPVQHGAAVFAITAGLIGLYWMYRSYRIPARPYWDHGQVFTSFFGTMFSFGSLVLALLAVPTLLLSGEGNSNAVSQLLQITSALAAFGLVAEGLGLIKHAKYLNTESGEGAAAHYVQQTTFGKSYVMRNVLMAFSALLFASVALFLSDSAYGLVIAALAAPAMLVSLLVGRCLFYILVIPTTMPGAFFWKNKGFEEHARDVGLADMPQTGVVPACH
ncbi:MAG: DmsC/YnfH family molybdoenzyme membrane anchor subunit [Bermanella sp.]